MLIENVGVKIVGLAALDDTPEDRGHWVGRTGVVERLDIGENMLIGYESDGRIKYCQTKKVDEILIRGNTINVEDGFYRYILERL